MQHEIFSILKCVFLAVEDFQAMTAATKAISRQLRHKSGDTAELESARDFVEWLLDENYVFLGIARYIGRSGRTAAAHRRQRQRRLQRPGTASGGLPRPPRRSGIAHPPGAGGLRNRQPRFLPEFHGDSSPVPHRLHRVARVGRCGQFCRRFPSAGPLFPRDFRAARREDSHPAGKDPVDFE